MIVLLQPGELVRLAHTAEAPGDDKDFKVIVDIIERAPLTLVPEEFPVRCPECRSRT